MIKKLFSFCLLILLFFSCEKDKPGEDIILNNNIIFKDIDNKTYEFKDFSEQNKGILIFAFATWCGYSRKEFINIFKIDTLFSDKLKIIGLDCTNKDDTIDIKKFIILKKIAFPVTKISWNADIDKLLFPDSVYTLPSIVYLDKKLNKKYYQLGYSTSTVDSIKKYVK